MSGSMSVHLLIDKFSHDDRGRAHSQPPRPRLALPHKAPWPQEPVKLPAAGPQPQPQPLPQPLLSLLVGADLAALPLSEAALLEALKLRSEQERTKQEQFRAETAARNLEIITMAQRHDVPPHLWPQMVLGKPALARLEDNAAPVPPASFRFGSPAPLVPSIQVPNRRPLLPAKLGAQAVASLANPVTPYRPAHRTLPAHQRHFSMPDKRAPVLPSSLALQARTAHRPRPPPPQEAMLLFQHVIQFHQWKPESPGPRHKRHKLHDMLIDLGSDVLMDAEVKKEDL